MFFILWNQQRIRSAIGQVDSIAAMAPGAPSLVTVNGFGRPREIRLRQFDGHLAFGRTQLTWLMPVAITHARWPCLLCMGRIPGVAPLISRTTEPLVDLRFEHLFDDHLRCFAKYVTGQFMNRPRALQ